jgi:hypothetical protein
MMPVSIEDALSISATAVPVLAAVYVLTRGLIDECKGKNKRSLVEHLGRATAAGGVPSALILIVGAIKPSTSRLSRESICKSPSAACLYSTYR